MKRSEISEREFFRRELGNAGKGLGWIAAQAAADVPIAGVHVHVLDHVGHVYAERPERLREAYRTVDDLLGWLRERVSRLVVLSDHGMQTAATDDPDPGVHSWHATFATTESTDSPPESVLDVRDWLAARIDSAESDETTTTVDAPTEHLRELGYID